MTIRDPSSQLPFIRKIEWRHKKTGGRYVIVCHAIIEATMEPAVVYTSLNPQKPGTFVRPSKEFFDGRFTEEGYVSEYYQPSDHPQGGQVA